MADLIGDDTPYAPFSHPIGDDTPFAPFSHPERTAYLGPRLPNRMIVACQPILRQIRKKNRKCGGYLHQTSGIAAGFLRALRDPRARTPFLRISRISPDNYGDEDIARTMALALILNNLERRFDDELYKHLPRIYHEGRIVHKLHMLGDDCSDDTDRHADTALDRLEAAIDAVMDDAVRYTGRCIERDFDGLRAPKLVAEFFNHTFGRRPKLTEDQVRYSCGWIAAKP
jgi:hypothetical protein